MHVIYIYIYKAKMSVCVSVGPRISCQWLIHSCQPSRNGRDSPRILGPVPLMLVMSRIYTPLALPSAGFHSLMAAPRISSVLSNLVLFDTHKATTKTVLRHFLTEKSQNYYNFGSSVWLCANSEQPLTLFHLEVWHTRRTTQSCALAGIACIAISAKWLL